MLRLKIFRDHQTFGYWIKGDFEKPLIGLPQFPEKYKSFERVPIETQIISVKERIIEKERTLGNAIYPESAFYKVIIGAGKDERVKKGMKFIISETGDELIIIQINKNSAVGLIPRSINEGNKEDYCYKENTENTTCPQVENGLKIKTQIGNFSW